MGVTRCVRRPYSVWTNCKCESCRVDMRRMAKIARNGLYRRPPVAEAWEVLDDLVARGWSPKAIGSATGTPWRRWHATLREFARTGRRRDMSPSSCAALGKVGTPTEGHIGAVGTRRRLQALSRIGWDLYTLEDLTGIGFTTLAQIRAGKTARVSARFATTVHKVYAEKCMTQGPSRQAVMHAERKGWLGALAWDDIDDPNEQPQGARRTSRDDIDEAVVLRVLDGERLETTRAEKTEILRRWKAAGGSERALCLRMNWKAARYGQEAS